MATGAQPAWAGQEFRLDPARLPQELSYAPHDETGETTITVTRRGATVKKTLAHSGLPLNIALPSRAFRGIAVRATGETDEDAIVTLELLHEDPALCVPLSVGSDLPAIARDWQIWSEIMNLPMLMVDAEGRVQSLDPEVEEIAAGQPCDRRRHAMFAERRPRFLARRRLGTLGVRLVVTGEEIIARDPRI